MRPVGRTQRFAAAASTAARTRKALLASARRRWPELPLDRLVAGGIVCRGYPLPDAHGIHDVAGIVGVKHPGDMAELVDDRPTERAHEHGAVDLAVEADAVARAGGCDRMLAVRLAFELHLGVEGDPAHAQLGVDVRAAHA